MKTLAMPAPRLRLLRSPVAFRLVLLALGARALLARRRRPTASGLDFSDLAADAPNWVTQLTERDE